MYNIMDKESSVRSNIIPDKIYNGTLDTLDKDDNEIESDLYSIKIFGKNIRIAPGRSKDVNPKCVYFYVYAIKNEKVVAKLGVYEKELSSLEDKVEIYDLTQFKDGSLLLFDVYYNKPDLISNLEELEELEEESKQESKKNNVGTPQKILEIMIDGVDYILKGNDIFDLNNKKVGTRRDTNMINWMPNAEPKKNNASQIKQSGKIILKDKFNNAFDTLNEFIKINEINIIPNQTDVISQLKLVILDQGKTLPERRKFTNILNEMFQKNKNNALMIEDDMFFENLKKIQKTKSNQNSITVEDKTIIILYFLENLLNIQFIFKTTEYDDYNISKIINIKFLTNAEKEQKRKIIIVMDNKEPLIASTYKLGTSLNQGMPVKNSLNTELSKQLLGEDIDEEQVDEEKLDVEGPNSTVKPVSTTSAVKTTTLPAFNQPSISLNAPENATQNAENVLEKEPNNSAANNSAANNRPVNNNRPANNNNSAGTSSTGSSLTNEGENSPVSRGGARIKRSALKIKI